MKDRNDNRSGQGTKDGNAKGGKGSSEKTEPKKKTDTGKTAK
jgi:hypothetical protein